MYLHITRYMQPHLRTGGGLGSRRGGGGSGLGAGGGERRRGAIMKLTLQQAGRGASAVVVLSSLMRSLVRLLQLQAQQPARAKANVQLRG